MTDLSDGHYTAVVDRLEDDLAVLEVETDDGLAELVVEVARLPTDARQADAVCSIEIHDGTVVAIQFDLTETSDRRAAAQSLFDRLARRLNVRGDRNGHDEHTGQDESDRGEESDECTGRNESDDRGDAETDADERDDDSSALEDTDPEDDQ